MTTLSMRALLTGSVAAAALLLGGAAQAASYEFGDVSVSFDNTLSLGTGLRASGQDCTHIGANNGGCSAESGFLSGPAAPGPFDAAARCISSISRVICLK